MLSLAAIVQRYALDVTERRWPFIRFRAHRVEPSRLLGNDDFQREDLRSAVGYRDPHRRGSETFEVLRVIPRTVLDVVQRDGEVVAGRLGNRILTLPEWLICLVGVRLGPKKFRICPIVIADEAGSPVVPLATIQSQIDTAVRVYAQCGIDVIASPITTATGRPYLANASGCNAAGYFGGDRVEFETLSCCNGLLESLKCLRFPSGLIWPRQILKAVWVSTISSGERGCYLLPESFILIAASGAQDTLAHEMGHAGDLLHSSTANNLMTTPVRTGSNLTNFQCCTVRTSRFVTLL